MNGVVRVTSVIGECHFRCHVCNDCYILHRLTQQLHHSRRSKLQTYSASHSYSLCLSHTHTHRHSVAADTHTHTHTHTQTQTQTQSQIVFTYVIFDLSKPNPGQYWEGCF